MTFFFGNVTSFSEEVVEYALGLPPCVHGFLFVESHLRADKLSTTTSTSIRHGWVPVAAEASASDRSEQGTFGKCFCSTRSHLQVLPLSECTWDPRGLWLSNVVDLLGWEVPLQGDPILVLGSYHRHGPASANFEAVARWTSVGRFPFVLLGDFNDSPEQLAELPWLSILNCQLLLPSNSSVTCRAREDSESLIDFGLVSTSASQLVTLETVDAVPWPTHCGLRLTVQKQPNRWQHRVLETPARFPPLSLSLIHI